MTFLNFQPFFKIALFISIFIALAGFLTDFKNTQQYGGVDLRNRVVATRVASELDQDPYFFKWTADLSDRYLDPSDNASISIARVTVTPAVLALHSLLSFLPYETQRYLWFFIQWACLLGSILLLTKLTTEIQTKILIWILGLLAISGSMFWRLHTERGQMYIIYVFLFCLALYLYHRYQNKIASGLMLGYLASLRPTYFLVIIPFLIYKKFKFASLIITAVIISVFLSSLLSSTPLWKNYYQSMRAQGAMRMEENTNFKPISLDNAEGINLKKFLAVPGEDSSLQTIFRGLFNTWFSSTALFTFLLVCLAVLTYLLLKFKIPQINVPQLFFIAITPAFFSEFFIAAQRWPYADVIWLIPISLIIILSKNITISRLTLLSYTLIILGLLSSVGFHLISRFTLVGDIGIPTAIILFIINMFKQKNTQIQS